MFLTEPPTPTHTPDKPAPHYDSPVRVRKIDLRAVCLTPTHGKVGIKKERMKNKSHERKSFMTLLFSFMMDGVWPHGRDSSLKCKFCLKWKGRVGRVNATIHLLKPKSKKKKKKHDIIPSKMQKNKIIQWYSKLPPESQNHCNVIYTFFKNHWSLLIIPPSSGLTCVADCGVCESMLQDSGTPSLPSPLSVSVWVPESLLAWIEQPLGPKEQWTRPLRKKTVGASQCGLGWSSHQGHQR